MNNNPELNSQQIRYKPHPAPLSLKLIRLAFSIGGRLAPKLAGSIAYKLWLTPTRHQTPMSEIRALETAKLSFLRQHGQSITTYSWGQSGPVILFVHGWSGRGTQVSAFIDPLIKAGYRLVSFDAPAHGKSTGKRTNLFEIADAILAMQNKYGEFHSVITHSFGGPCAAVALQQGLTTRGIVNISPPACTRGIVDIFIRALRLPDKTGKNLSQRIEKDYGPNIWDETSMVNTVKPLKIPGLLIHDELDREVPWQDSLTITETWDNARFNKTSGLGHRRILRDRTVIESTIKFISDEIVEN